MAEITKVSKRAFAMMVKCYHTKKTFGVTVDPTSEGFKMVWAFRMSERQGKKEKYDNNHVHGKVFIDDNYPGCPYCGAKNFTSCLEECGGCGHVSCYDGSYNHMICPWCGEEYDLVEGTEFDLSGGGY